jgi:hypothetical protein
MFTNLTPGQQREFERVFDDLQNTKELSSLETSLQQLKRKVDQNLPIPQVTSRPTPRGAVLEWDAIADQRINKYEVDIGDNAVFSTFETVPTIGTVSVIDGLLATKFARVRGVRNDGTTTPYSEVVEINPNLFDITSHAQEAFYFKIVGTDANTVLGGPNSDLAYTPINENGNSMVFGFMSTYGDPAVGMFGLDEITAEVVVKTYDEGGTLLDTNTPWKMTIGEFFQSQAIGPFTFPHPNLNKSLEFSLNVTDRTTLANGDPRSADSTEVFWAHLNILELGITEP